MLGVHVWHAFHRQQSFLINRDLNSEVFRHFLRTGRERQEVTWLVPFRQVYGLKVTFVRLDHAPEVSDLPQGFFTLKQSQFHF